MSCTRRSVLPAFLLSCLLVLAAPRARAQQVYGTILGTITDTSGAAIPGVKVTVRNLGTGIENHFVTDATGNYEVTYLVPGTYAVATSKEGFKSVTKSGITLLIDQRARVDLSLEVGQVTTNVTVTGEAPQVRTDSSEVATVVESKTIVDVPLQIRDFASLISLTPGVLQAASGQGQIGSTGGQFDNPDNPMGPSGNFVNGQYADSNNFQIDGVSNNEGTLGLIAVNPSVDAIAEFKVATNSYSAEYGRAGAANINISIKTGTNRFHGTAFDFARRNRWDATPWDVNRAHQHNPPLRMNQYGGNIGGPIKKDKLFFFSSFERYWIRRTNTEQFLVPTMLQRQGIFSEPGNSVIYNPFNLALGADGKMHPQPFGDGKVDSTNAIQGNNCGFTHDQACFGLSPAAANITKLIPPPNLVTSDVNHPNFFGSGGFFQDRKNYDERVDYTIGAKDQMFAEYSLLGSTSANPNLMSELIGGAPWLAYTGKDTNYHGVISEIHQFSPRTVNEFRFGASHIGLGWFSFDQNLKTADKVGIPGINGYGGICGGLPYMTVSGFFEGAPGFGFNSLGHAPFTPTFRHEAVFNWVDDVTHIQGRHSWKFGADIQREQINLLQDELGIGAFAFDNRYTSNLGAGGNSYATFLLGLPNGCGPCDHNSGSAAYRETHLTFPSQRRSRYAFYGQDDWKYNEKLTLNLGLRWEYFPGPTDAWHNLANFDFNTGDILLACIATSCSGGVKADKYNFMPRIGLAYSPDRTKTAFHAAFGVSSYYPGYIADVLDGQYPFTSILNVPTSNPLYITQGDPTLDQGLPLVQKNGIPYITLRNGQAGHVIPMADAPNHVLNISQVDTTGVTPRVYQWNFGVQRQLTPNLALDVAYVANRGLHMDGRMTVNIPPLGKFTADKAAGLVKAFQQDRPYYAIDPQLANITQWLFGGRSSYDSLQVQLNKRFSKGLWFQGSYTYSKTLEQGPYGSGNTTFEFDPYHYMTEPGKFIAGQDRRHIFVLSYNYELPFGRNMQWGKNWSGPVDTVLGGWELGGITSLRSGAPIDPNGGNVNGSTDNTTSNHPNRVCNGAISNRSLTQWFNPNCFINPGADPNTGLYDGKWANNVYGNSGVNILSGPSFANFDLTLKKDIHLWSESRYLQVRGEFYDAFNHVNFANPTGTVSVSCTNPAVQGTCTAAAGGANITAAGSPIITQVGGLKAREVQLGLKLYF